MQYAPVAGVSRTMTVLTQANHPARLAAIFFGTIAAFGVVLTAALALYLVVLDMRHAHAPWPPSSAADVQSPNGIIVVIPAATPQEFEAIAGFPPFVPSRVPSSTDPTPKFAVTQPDASGFRVGRVAFSAKPDAVDGVTGPVIVIGEAYGKPGDGVDGELKSIVSGARGVAATLPCGDLVIDVQLYFSPTEPAEGEELITPYMREVGRGFLDDVKADCRGR